MARQLLRQREQRGGQFRPGGRAALTVEQHQGGRPRPGPAGAVQVGQPGRAGVEVGDGVALQLLDAVEVAGHLAGLALEIPRLIRHVQRQGAIDQADGQIGADEPIPHPASLTAALDQVGGEHGEQFADALGRYPGQGTAEELELFQVEVGADGQAGELDCQAQAGATHGGTVAEGNQVVLAGRLHPCLAHDPRDHGQPAPGGPCHPRQRPDTDRPPRHATAQHPVEEQLGQVTRLPLSLPA